MSDTTNIEEMDDQREAGVQDEQDSESKPIKGERGNKDEALSRLARQRDAERERSAALEKELESIRATQREADEAKAREEGRYKELLEAREAELAELRQREQERELADKRRKIAKDAGLAEELADRIVGTTDEEMAADAKRLATFFHREDGPDTDSGKRSATGKGTPKKDSLLASYEFGKRR